MDNYDTIDYKFDLYGALWLLCSRWYGGQWSRGYRLLSRLILKGYKPGLSLQENKFETERQRNLYCRYFKLRMTL